MSRLTASQDLRLFLIHTNVLLHIDVVWHLHLGELGSRTQGDIALNGRTTSLAIEHFRDVRLVVARDLILCHNITLVTC